MTTSRRSFLAATLAGAAASAAPFAGEAASRGAGELRQMRFGLMQVGFGAGTCGHESGEWRLCLLRAFSPHTSSTDPLANSLEGRTRPAQAHGHRPIYAALSGDPDSKVTESASLSFLICGNSPIGAQGSKRPLGS